MVEKLLDAVAVARGVDLLLIDDDAILHNADQRTLYRLPADRVADLLAALSELREPSTVGHATTAMAEATGASDSDAAAEVAAFVRAGILVESDAAEGFDSTVWNRFGWEDAHSYHRHLRFLPIIDWSLAESLILDRDLMREYLGTEQPPTPYLERTDTVGTHPLPAVSQLDLAPVRVLTDTLTEPVVTLLELDDLVLILVLAFGQTGTRTLPVTGSHVTKTSPSGGSRHPIEAFVLLSEDIGSLSVGRYHFNVRTGGLDQLDTLSPSEHIRDHVLLLRDRPGFRPVVTVVLVAVCERSMFRYRESRSYRVLHHDAGHILQTVAYLASSLDRPSYRGYTLHEAEVTSYLGLDPLFEVPLAYVVIG